MNEPKPEDVMKALELHADCETDNCFECPYEKYLSKADGNCVHHLSMDALALLREKDAEIERLKAHNKELDNLCDLLHKKLDEGYAEFANEERAEAITEFAEKLKIFYNRLPGKTVGGSVEYHIDQIAKEMRRKYDTRIEIEK